MSALPNVTVTLDKHLNGQERTKVRQKIKKINGVLSANFNAKATEISVTYTTGKTDVKKEIQKIGGIANIKHRF